MDTEYRALQLAWILLAIIGVWVIYYSIESNDPHLSVVGILIWILGMVLSTDLSDSRSDLLESL